MPAISVIVPIYKAEKYLTRCVESILNQSFADLEVILVDDGSPDNCPRICDAYAKVDKRVRVIHKDNAGVSSARNKGIDASEGKYIAFVDSDDWLEPNMYSEMMNTAVEYDCDLVLCDCVKDYPDRSEVYTHHIRQGFYDYDHLLKEYYPHLLMMENVEYPATISNWLCLWRRDLARGNLFGDHLNYVESVRFSEDLLFGAQLMSRANSFYYMKGQAYYHYCMNEDSVTHSFDSAKWKNYKLLYEEAEQYFLRIKVYDFRKQLDLMLLFFVYNYLSDLRSGSCRMNYIDRFEAAKEVMNDREVQKMMNRLSVLGLKISLRQKLLTAIYANPLGLRAMMAITK